MKKNKFNPKTKRKGFSMKQQILSFVLFLVVGFAFAQNTVTITTDSRDPAWTPTSITNDGNLLKWDVSGAVSYPTVIGDLPVFDLSASGGMVTTIVITKSDLDPNLNLLKGLEMSGLDILSIDLQYALGLEVLKLPGNKNIGPLDLSNNISLIELNFKGNRSTAILDLTNNVNLEILKVDNNDYTSLNLSSNSKLLVLNAEFNELTSLALSSNPLLEELQLANNKISFIDLSVNPNLSVVDLDNNFINNTMVNRILEDLDGNGVSNGQLEIDQNIGYITKDGLPFYTGLIARGWDIDLKPIFDYGDAPSSYKTTIAEGGPRHIRVERPEFQLGLLRDHFEGNGLPGVLADGDDLDDVDDLGNPTGLNDEDGVPASELTGLLESMTSFTVNVGILNNTGKPGFLHGWIDFDGNGKFDDDEHAVIPVAPFLTPVAPNLKGAARKKALKKAIAPQALNWTNLGPTGTDIKPGDTYARFRLTFDDITPSDVGGVVDGGEVEDYAMFILNDSDGDGIPDTVDVDDDNDGILDVVEDNGTPDRDSNNDNVPDRMSIDADGDLCFDAIEGALKAGDPDGNGRIGTSPLTVDATGKVIADANGPINDPADAYTVPLPDLNGNSIPDFQEVGAVTQITTQPVDIDFVFNTVIFSVSTDIVAPDTVFQWQIDKNDGSGFNDIVEGGDYIGTQAKDLVVTNTKPDMSKLYYKFQVIVKNIAYACDLSTTSDIVGFIEPDDSDNDGIFDLVDVDDDNDGILDAVEGDMDTTGDGIPDVFVDSDGDGTRDSLELDADDDACFDVIEAGFTGNVFGELGTVSPPVVDATGKVTSATDGYTDPTKDINGDYNFQVKGTSAILNTQPTDQVFIIGNAMFSVTASANASYTWNESKDGGNTWLPLADGGDYSGTATANLSVNISDATKVNYKYQVLIQNVDYACDPTTVSNIVGFIIPEDTDLDGVFDLFDVDDDNDGILDTVEGDMDTTGDGIPDIFVDSDGDGIRDSLELDADDDACFDVIEAGFTGNVFGELGTVSPPVVDATGKVTSATDGYTDPIKDINGDYNFQVKGISAIFITQPTDQHLILNNVMFTADATTNATFSWEESIDKGITWSTIVDGGDYSGSKTNTLTIANTNFDKLLYQYKVVIQNMDYACDPITDSNIVGFITPGDFDGDGIFDLVDVDDDNDGILDTVEDDGIVDRDTDDNGVADRIQLDADNDNCFDVTEAGYIDGDNDGEVGTAPLTVDADGKVISDANGPVVAYGVPNDLDVNGIPDFQEKGIPALITTQPTNQDMVLGDVSFVVLAVADTFQWQEDKLDGNGFVNLVDGGDYLGANTDVLTVSNTDFNKVYYRYRVIVQNIAYACDPTETSIEVEYITPGDFDKDGVFDDLDVDDDNDGILDVDESGNTDTATNEDRINLDADSDGCPDVSEAGFTNNGNNQLGNQTIPVVDATGRVTSATDGYTTPNDLNNSGTPDFQEKGAAPTITAQPVNVNVFEPNGGTFTVTGTGSAYQWQEDKLDGSGFVDLSDGGNYIGATTATLTLLFSNESMNGYKYRVKLTNISYSCNPELISDEAILGVIKDDFDNDGVPNNLDVDDDNDGILDADEPGNTDPSTSPDRVNLDTDSDGCFDVTEAGFTDDNGDGYLGNAPVTVDAQGRVTSGSDGYTLPLADLNNSGTPDFQEKGSSPIISVQPVDQAVFVLSQAEFTVLAATDSYQWQESKNNGVNWADINDNLTTYSGTKTNVLTVKTNDINLQGNLYRVILTNPSYACQPITISNAAKLNLLIGDFDNDGVPDFDDVDDDNDGILDIDEPGNTTIGTPDDRVNLDSDNDNCTDVSEAGFTDVNSNGMLGDSPITVDAQGRVISAADGYTTPNDLNNSGTPDFQEIGTSSKIIEQPKDIEISLLESAYFMVEGEATFYQWEESRDGGNSWIILTEDDDVLDSDKKYVGVNEPTLIIQRAGGILEGSLYRVALTSPNYVCDKNTVLYSENAVLNFNTKVIPNGISPNGDGKNDVFKIPGLEREAPNFSVKIYNRWGAPVYDYKNDGNTTPEWWDGYSSGNLNIDEGKIAPSGTYFYLIEYNNNKNSSRSGWVYVNY